MDCKKCKQYCMHTVEVINTITKRLYWLCFHCWSGSKYYKLSSTRTRTLVEK